MNLVSLSRFPALTQLSPPTNAPGSELTGSLGSQTSQIVQAKASLQQALNRYTAYFRTAKSRPSSAADQDLLRQNMERLTLTLTKLENQIVRVAVFGLVSRGKSAVLNAILGQKILPTGPLNGVTQAPRSVYWTPDASSKSPAQSSLQIELIDTPGLDEIDGQARAQMAQDIARQADLILFVVSGDITRTEYQALCDLRQAQKPLLLVFNKIDLYPDRSRQSIYQNLQRLAAKSRGSESLQRLLSANEIVLVAAEPTPLQVRVEQPDGRITYERETPPIQIEALKRKIIDILQREGRTLLALNALFQARDAESVFASKILELRSADAEDLIWKFVRYKAIAVALNPIAVLDLTGGAISDLAMIRALSELYGLPVTRHEARKLWKTIWLSSGSLLLGEVGSGILLGLGKSAAAIAAGADSATSFSAYAGVSAIQAGIAGYGAYAVGRATQVYLEHGCSWGPQGPNTVIQSILSQLDSTTIVYRLRQELSQEIGLPHL